MFFVLTSLQYVNFLAVKTGNPISVITPAVIIMAVVIMAALTIRYGIKQGFRPDALPASSHPNKLHAWLVVAILWVIAALMAHCYAVCALFSSLVVRNGHSLYIIVALSTASVALLGGCLSDRLGRRFILLCSITLCLFSYWMTIHSPALKDGKIDVWVVLCGVSMILFFVSSLALIADYHRGWTRSISIAAYISGFYTASLFNIVPAPWSLFLAIVALAVSISLNYSSPTIAGAHVPNHEKDIPLSQDYSISNIFGRIFSGRFTLTLLAVCALAVMGSYFLIRARLPYSMSASFLPYDTPRYLFSEGLHENMRNLLLDSVDKFEGELPDNPFLNFSLFYVIMFLAAIAADVWYRINKDARAFVLGITFCVVGGCAFLAYLLSNEALLSALSFSSCTAWITMLCLLMPVLLTRMDERFSATSYGLLLCALILASLLMGWLLLDLFRVKHDTALCSAGILLLGGGALLFFLPKKINYRPTTKKRIQNTNSRVSLRFTFQGRIRRRTFWWSTLALYGICVGAAMIYCIIYVLLFGVRNLDVDEMVRSISIISVIIGIPAFVCNMSLTVRRMHDIGYKTVWGVILRIVGLLVNFLPANLIVAKILFSIFGIYLMCKDSKQEPNKWGISPKYGNPDSDTPSEEEAQLPPMPAIRPEPEPRVEPPLQEPIRVVEHVEPLEEEKPEITIEPEEAAQTSATPGQEDRTGRVVLTFIAAAICIGAAIVNSYKYWDMSRKTLQIEQERQALIQESEDKARERQEMEAEHIKLSGMLRQWQIRHEALDEKVQVEKESIQELQDQVKQLESKKSELKNKLN